MSESEVACRRLDSWKEIAKYLGRNERTAIRWERQKGMPVHRVPGGQRQAVFAFSHELDAWLLNREIREELANASEKDLGPPELASVAPRFLIAEQSQSESGNANVGSQTDSKHLGRRFWIAAAVVIFGVVAWIAGTNLRNHEIEVLGTTQITADEMPKERLIGDREKLYFSEFRDGRYQLAMVPVTGGAVQIIQTSFAKAIPLDVSPDRQNLLVLGFDGIWEDYGGRLWIVPISGGKARSVGQIHCKSAVWSPDGRLIAYTANNGVYVVRNEGVDSELLQSFSSFPQSLRWSPDGSFIRVALRDSTSVDFSFWDLFLRREPKVTVASLVPLPVTLRNVWTDFSLDSAGRSIIVGRDSKQDTIYLLRRSRWPWHSLPSTVPLSLAMDEPGYVTSSGASTRVYLMARSEIRGESLRAPHRELIRFNPASGTFALFWPSRAAMEVDYSRDGKSIVFVHPQDHSLWVSAANGTLERQLSGWSFEELELPHWSPDGKKIAFMARSAGNPWRVFIVNKDGTNLREASSGTDNQGAPTWSPDGKWLSYGNVRCPKEQACQIHTVQVSTGEESTIPGSDGLSTARWSPNGRWIAALRPEKQEVALYDRTTKVWSTIAGGITGNNLAWSADSTHVYAIRPNGDHPAILRISPSGAMDIVVNLTEFARLPETLEPWFAVAPDSSIIFARIQLANEVYRVDYKWK